jgi:hypothetical protein
LIESLQSALQQAVNADSEDNGIVTAWGIVFETATPHGTHRFGIYASDVSPWRLLGLLEWWAEEIKQLRKESGQHE